MNLSYVVKFVRQNVYVYMFVVIYVRYGALLPIWIEKGFAVVAEMGCSGYGMLLSTYSLALSFYVGVLY
jgi:hypothetical protein